MKNRIIMRRKNEHITFSTQPRSIVQWSQLQWKSITINSRSTRQSFTINLVLIEWTTEAVAFLHNILPLISKKAWHNIWDSEKKHKANFNGDCQLPDIPHYLAKGYTKSLYIFEHRSIREKINFANLECIKWKEIYVWYEFSIYSVRFGSARLGSVRFVLEIGIQN